MLILRHLLLPSTGFFLAAQGCGQHPQILVALDPPKMLLRGQVGTGHPAQHYVRIASAADVARSFGHARLRTLDEVGGGQAAMQAGRPAQPVQGEGLFQPFAQTGCRRRPLVFEEPL